MLKGSKTLMAIAFVAVLSIAWVNNGYTQKNINFTGPFTIEETLLFGTQVYPDTYVFRLDFGDRVRLDVNSSDFDTTIRVVGPNAAIALFDDDGGPGLNSRLTFTAADTGYYIAVVSTFSGTALSGRGDYTLRLQRLNALRGELSIVGAVNDDMVGGFNIPEEK